MQQAKIDAYRRWNSTKIILSSDKSYKLTARGLWIDFYIPSGPNGYGTPLFIKSQLRFPQANLFTLIGSIEANEKALFSIGSELIGFTPASTGELTCFANDVWYMYWNNWLSVTLTVVEI